MYEYFETGSLLDPIKKTQSVSKSDGINEEIVKIILKEILLGLEQLHSQKIIAKCLKTTSLFISLNADIKLFNFSFGRTFNEAFEKNKTYMTINPVYLSPEVIKNNDYSERSDIWSVGMIAIELFEGNKPFAQSYSPNTVFDILDESKRPPILTKPCSYEFHEFVDSCLKKETKLRKGVKELLNSSFIKSAKEKSKLCNFVNIIQEKFTSEFPNTNSQIDVAQFNKSEFTSKFEINNQKLNDLIEPENFEYQNGLAEEKKLRYKIKLLNEINSNLVANLFKEILENFEKNSSE